MFHVTVAAEIERSQIKAMQYLQKNIKLEYVSWIKLPKSHETHISMSLKANPTLLKKIYVYIIFD